MSTIRASSPVMVSSLVSSRPPYFRVNPIITKIAIFGSFENFLRLKFDNCCHLPLFTHVYKSKSNSFHSIDEQGTKEDRLSTVLNCFAMKD